MRDPLTRYRVMAWIVGVGLIILFFVGLPTKYIWHNKGVVEVVGPLHGFLYIVYLVTAIDLAFRRRWAIWKALLVMLAGTVPFLSFVVEHWVTKNDLEYQAHKAVPATS